MTLPSSENKEQFVHKLFSQLANNYDLMNDLITGGLHRLWKKEACLQTLTLGRDFSSSPNPRRGLQLTSQPPKGALGFKQKKSPLRGDLGGTTNSQLKILDLACGTGDISFLLNKLNSQVNITGLDFCQEMLDIAINKNNSNNIQFVQGNALKLDLPDNSFDSVIISYGLRNMSDYSQCIKEVYRVLKPNGKFIILDMSVPNPLINILSYPHRHIVVPLLGRIFAQDSDSYKYLVNSIKIYLNQKELKELLINTGFKEVKYKNFIGGVSALHSGVK